MTSLFVSGIATVAMQARVMPNSSTVRKNNAMPLHPKKVFQGEFLFSTTWRHP
jgi:hypothetical protein